MNSKNVAEELNIDWKVLTRHLDSVPLSAVMSLMDARQTQNAVRELWNVPLTGHTMEIKGHMWKNWTTDDGGASPISLLAQHIATVENINLTNTENKSYARKSAIVELTKEFGHDAINLLQEYIGVVKNINVKTDAGKESVQKILNQEFVKEFGRDFNTSNLLTQTTKYALEDNKESDDKFQFFMKMIQTTNTNHIIANVKRPTIRS